MAVTAALLEFVVIGSAWASLGWALLALAPRIGLAPFPFDGLPIAGTESTVWILLPGIYAVGIITQTLTWRWWYMPRVHRPDLNKELESHRKCDYAALFDTMKNHGYTIPGLSRDLSALQDGTDLARFLDALRWELFACPAQEPARQYLLQFHLYRISYGILPPLFVGLVVSPIAWIAPRANESTAASVGAGCLVSGLLAVMFVGARISATHRRRRTWKYLVSGMNVILQSRTERDSD